MGKSTKFDKLIEEAEGIRKDKKEKKKVKGKKLATPSTYDFEGDVSIQMEMESLEIHFFPKTATVEDEAFILDSLLGEGADTHLIDALAEGTIELAGELLKCESRKEIAKWNKRLVKLVMGVLKEDDKFQEEYPSKELQKEAEKLLTEYVGTEDFISQLEAVIKNATETMAEEATLTDFKEDDGESVFLMSGVKDSVTKIFFSHDDEEEVSIKPTPSMAEIITLPVNDRSPGLQRYYALRSELKMPC